MRFIYTSIYNEKIPCKLRRRWVEWRKASPQTSCLNQIITCWIIVSLWQKNRKMKSPVWPSPENVIREGELGRGKMENTLPTLFSQFHLATDPLAFASLQEFRSGEISSSSVEEIVVNWRPNKWSGGKWLRKMRCDSPALLSRKFFGGDHVRVCRSQHRWEVDHIQDHKEGNHGQVSRHRKSRIDRRPLLQNHMFGRPSEKYGKEDE